MTRVEPPPLQDSDVYLYMHGNGAITLVPADHRSRFVTLAEAAESARACHVSGGRVLLDRDDSPLAQSAYDSVVSLGVVVVDYEAPEPPYRWDEGTTALISAAAFGRDAILDDLIERGVDVHARDDSGANALHHAAGNGNLYGVERLAEAGVDINLPNGKGFTPYMLAVAFKADSVAERLLDLGANRSVGPESELRFSRDHYGMWAPWIIPLALVVLLPLAWYAIRFDPRWLPAVVVLALIYAFAMPWREHWSGGIPRALKGEILTLRRPFGPTREVDLSQVVYAGTSGSLHRPVSRHTGSGCLLLAHPDGRRLTRRALQRLGVASEKEVDAILEADVPIIVVPIGLLKRDEVLLPVGNLLTVLGADLTGSLREALDRARNDAVSR